MCVGPGVNEYNNVHTKYTVCSVDLIYCSVVDYFNVPTAQSWNHYVVYYTRCLVTFQPGSGRVLAGPPEYQGIRAEERLLGGHQSGKGRLV